MWGFHPQDLIIPKVPPPNTATLGLGFQHVSFRGTQTFRDLVIPQRFYLPMPPHWGLEFQRMEFRGTEILRPQQTADRHGILTNRSECVPINLGFPGGQTIKNLPAMWETWVQSLGQEDPLEEGVATHSSILTWRIPRTEEPGGLQSMWSQRIRYDWATKHSTYDKGESFCL